MIISHSKQQTCAVQTFHLPWVLSVRLHAGCLSQTPRRSIRLWRQFFYSGQTIWLTFGTSRKTVWLNNCIPTQVSLELTLKLVLKTSQHRRYAERFRQFYTWMGDCFSFMCHLTSFIGRRFTSMFLIAEGCWVCMLPEKGKMEVSQKWDTK